MTERVEFTNCAPTFEVEAESFGTAAHWNVTRRSVYTKQGWHVGRYTTECAARAVARFLAAMAHLELDATANRENELAHAAADADWAIQGGGA